MPLKLRKFTHAQRREQHRDVVNFLLLVVVIRRAVGNEMVESLCKRELKNISNEDAIQAVGA